MLYSKRNYNDPKYKQWRISVYKRDGFKCKFPGCSNNKKINAHHIVRWADAEFLRYDISNGITLCSLHHKLVTGNENTYMKLFIDIIQKKS